MPPLPVPAREGRAPTFDSVRQGSFLVAGPRLVHHWSEREAAMKPCIAIAAVVLVASGALNWANAAGDSAAAVRHMKMAATSSAGGMNMKMTMPPMPAI